ncbi:MAG: triose-phosphate isomerase [Gammaproteobacteria bacterium]|jgi:triosephosphate isomerase|nr:triose-phosphate isomerase [Gammaproteobacteria bacterium]
MRKPLVAGNWKMNGTSASNQSLLERILASADDFSDIDVAIFPPAVYVHQVQQALTGTGLHWGTQNVSSYIDGAYTGEVSAAMITDFNCEYTLIGHSERRCLYDELDLDQLVLDQLVAEKYETAASSGLTPIICIGESPQEHDQGQTEEVVVRLLDTLIAHQGAKALSRTVLAYEPVWAIGTGKTASPEWAQNVHQFMRERVAKHCPTTAENLRILYGGSVKGNNAASLFSKPDIDGGLIGGASLIADEFVATCRAAAQQV